MYFQDLNISTPLLNAIQDMGYEHATPIQEQAYPVILSGKDMIGIAQTGTGKTIAYLLPLLRNLKYSEQKHPRILILVPTRELVIQITAEIEKLTKYMTVRFAGVYGGTNINTQKQVVYNGLDILVATPGRLVDLYLCGVFRLKSIQKLVIDEVDEMLNLGFQAQINTLIEALPARRQNLMFSATLNFDVDNLISDYFYEPVKVEIARHGTPLEKIIQKAYFLPNYGTKANLLEYLLLRDNELQKVLIFVANKKLADKLYARLLLKFPDEVGVLHSNKSQNFRINALKKFNNDEYRIMVATDIMARGLDISDVSHIVNFDTPEVPENYIHRIGRTGRAEKDGVAISFVEEHELDFFRSIEALMNFEIPAEELPDQVEISALLTEEEKLRQITYKSKRPVAKKTTGGGAFHTKSIKNQKVNSGSPAQKRAKERKKGSYRR